MGNTPGLPGEETWLPGFKKPNTETRGPNPEMSLLYDPSRQSK
jgi:hypothetical protein